MIIISMPIEQVSLIQIQPVIMMANGIKASIGTIDLIIMVIVIIQIQIDIQYSTHRSCHLDRDRDYENDCENKRNITNGCTSGQKHKRDYSSGNESNSNDIPPHGSIGKRQKYTDDQSYDKSNAYQGNEKYFDQKSSEKCYSPKHSNERFPGLHPNDHQSYENSNTYEVNKKFTNQKSSEKGYMPECDDKLLAVHPVNEKSPAHHQVNENSPAIHHDIQSILM